MDEMYDYDSEKFKDLVHFAIFRAISQYGPEALGNTKLHKIAYYVDMLHYLEKGVPLTGAEYQRQAFGPIARYLMRALRELESEGRISVTTSNYFGYSKSEYASLLAPRSNRISAQEIELIDHVTDNVCARTASEISEFSHDQVWASVPMGKRIPYCAAFAMFPYEISTDVLDGIAKDAVDAVPFIEAELRASDIL